MISVKTTQKIAKTALWIAGLSTVAILIMVIGYVLFEGIPVMSWEFLTDKPRKMGSKGGIFPIIVATVYFTALTLAIAAPIGVGAAIYLTEYTREGRLTRIIRFGTEALAGIPSIVFGLFGFAFFVILLEPVTHGWSLISGSLTGATMILPTLVRTSEEAIKTVPVSYREGSLALGATKWQTICKVVLPSALPGIVTGVILSIGRVIGETAALMLTLGGSLRMPESIFDPARTMSMHLYLVALEVGTQEATKKAFATGAVLIITIFLINTTANWVMKKFITKMS
ncbi:MAG: phosphate ABC transporter, permease protein PstA [Firmicutes bacterium HGW-Firmicutes-14]|nr:MAG: phosphate ABC transporter, permease protein PstA [Firmicutes bacterium HGW-Firmicutes-14]